MSEQRIGDRRFTPQERERLALETLSPIGRLAFSLGHLTPQEMERLALETLSPIGRLAFSLGLSGLGVTDLRQLAESFNPVVMSPVWDQISTTTAQYAPGTFGGDLMAVLDAEESGDLQQMTEALRVLCARHLHWSQCFEGIDGLPAAMKHDADARWYALAIPTLQKEMPEVWGLPEKELEQIPYLLRQRLEREAALAFVLVWQPDWRKGTPSVAHGDYKSGVPPAKTARPRQKRGGDKPPVPLEIRERRETVKKLFDDGLTNRVIAQRCACSLETVKRDLKELGLRRISQYP